jgi:asparagine synthetase B (glutamine-hydrolysing)
MLSGGVDSSAVVAMPWSLVSECACHPHIFKHRLTGACPETRAVHSMLRHVRATPTTLDVRDLDHGGELPPHLVNRARPFGGTMTLVEACWAASHGRVGP